MVTHSAPPCRWVKYQTHSSSFFSIILIAVLASLVIPPNTNAQCDFLRLDVNGDGQITDADSAAGLSFSPSSCGDAHDLNDDGALNILDFALWADYWANHYPSMPAGLFPEPWPTCGPDPTSDGLVECLASNACAVASDTDNDGVCQDGDNCPDTYNPGQEDDDGDGVGDHCDPWPGCDDRFDSDDDGVPNDCDICPGGNDYLDENNNSNPDDCDPICVNNPPDCGEEGGTPDNDLDGWCDPCDCDDFNPFIYPGAPENCDTRDNNCNGFIDEFTIVSNIKDWYADGDGDGYGSPTLVVKNCVGGPGLVSNNEDCADWVFAINPDAEEENCNGIDENCDGIDGFGCEFESPTPTGADVTVSLAECSVTFENVTAAGTSYMTRDQTGPEAASFVILPLTNPAYHNISTLAGYSGVVEVCISYSELLFVEGIAENEIVLIHWNGTTWEDATTSHDLENNVI